MIKLDIRKWSGPPNLCKINHRSPSKWSSFHLLFLMNALRVREGECAMCVFSVRLFLESKQLFNVFTGPIVGDTTRQWNETHKSKSYFNRKHAHTHSHRSARNEANEEYLKFDDDPLARLFIYFIRLSWFSMKNDTQWKSENARPDTTHSDCRCLLFMLGSHTHTSAPRKRKRKREKR